MKHVRELICGLLLVVGCGSDAQLSMSADAALDAGDDRGLVDGATPMGHPEAGVEGMDGSPPDSIPDAAFDATTDAETDADVDDAHVDSGPIDSEDAGSHLPTDCRSAPADDAVIDARTLPELVVDDVLLDTAGMVYVYSAGSDELYRWSTVTESALSTIALGADSTHVALSTTNNQIYVAYADGAVRQVDLATRELRDFVVMPGTPHGVATAGAFVMVADDSGAWATHHSFAANGSPISSVEWNYESLEYGYSEPLGMLYHLRENVFPGALMREPFDPLTGEIEEPMVQGLHERTSLSTDFDYPIVVAPDGAHVALGTGDVYSGVDLAYQGSLPKTIAAGLWLASGDLVTLAEDDGTTLLERWNEVWQRESVERLEGTPLRVFEHASQVWVLVDVDGRPRFVPSALSTDGDCDDVPYAADRFPLDPAAALDSDDDGYPDAWNVGHTHSLQGLVLDAFPDDSACYLPEHGAGGDPSAECDILEALDWYAFRDTFGVIDQRGIVYLFNPQSRQVGRWNAATGVPLNPLILSGLPVSATYSASRDRLYVALRSGLLIQFDPAIGTQPLPFAFAYQPLLAVIAAEDFIIAATEAAATSAFVSYAANGLVVDDHAHRSVPFGPAYSPAMNRLYFVDQWSEAHYVDVAPGTGHLGPTTSPFVFSMSGIRVSPPVRFSADGAEVFFGGGQVLDANFTMLKRTFPADVTDFIVGAPNYVIAIRSASPNTQIRRFTGAVEGGMDIVPGVPEMVLDAAGRALVVTIERADPVVPAREPPSFHFVDYWKDP